MSDSTPLDRDTQKAIKSAKRFNIEHLRKIGSTDWTIIKSGQARSYGYGEGWRSAALCATRSCHLSIMARAISSARSRGPVTILPGLSMSAGWMDTVHWFRSIPARTVYLIPLYSTGRPLA
jgi:hypothetical protein